MKRLILMCAMIAISPYLFACSSQRSVEVPCDRFYEMQHISKEIEVPVGNLFTVTLCSNPSTGFKWEEAMIGDQTVVEQVDHKYVSLEGKSPPPPGTPGQEVWTFRAIKAGQSIVSVEYGQPWEGGTKSEWTFALTVLVK